MCKAVTALIRRQARPLLWTMVLAYLPMLIVVVAVAGIAAGKAIPFEDVTRDVATVAGVPCRGIHASPRARG